MQLTPQQQKILSVIANHSGPSALTAQAIARQLGFARESTVRYHLEPMEEAGLVERTRPIAGTRTPRVAHLTETGRAMLPGETIALLGTAHAGTVGVQLDEPAEQLSFAQVFPISNGEYFLDVVGTCMAGGPRAIRPGDLVLVRPASRVMRPVNGSIAHVEIEVAGCENEVLLREYEYDDESGSVYLTHYHPRKKTIEYADEDVEVRGQVVRLIGNFEGGSK